MVIKLKDWMSRMSLSAALGMACWVADTGRLPGADALNSVSGVATTADQQKAAEKSFGDLYGKDEKAALASRDGADNIDLAKTLFTDSAKVTNNPALVEVMRQHAAMLLFKSNDKSAYDLALDLAKSALESEKAQSMAIMQLQADLLAMGVKEVPGADRAALYGKLVGLYQGLASLQMKGRLVDAAVKSLNNAANFANAANDRAASKDAMALVYVLKPMAPNAALLMKDLDQLKKTPDDSKLNTETVLLLVREWGDAVAAGNFLAKADSSQVKGLAEMAQFESGGKSTNGMDANALKTLAGFYEAWSKDGKDSKLARLLLVQRAAELYQAVASASQGPDAAAATKNADRLTTEAGRLEKETGPLLAAVSGGITASGAGSGGSKVPQKSASEVQRIIDTVGATDPSWLATTQMNYPNTLDLTWQQPPKGTPWNQSKWLGQFVWSTVNENPSQWQNGVKVMYKVMDVNKADSAKLTQTYNAVARMYFNYFKDYPRAAYWWKKAGNTDSVDMAHCYFHLGNVDMARKLLQGYPYDTTGNGDVIGAWGAIGDIDRAIRMAEARIQTNSPDVGYLLAGDICRMAGRYDDALKYYDGFLKLTGKLPQKHKDRAQDGYNTIKYFNMFDLSKVPDGTYRDSGIGYRGPVEAVVTVKGKKIVDIKVNHKEDQFYSSITDTPADIIAKQSVKGIDACAGATMTSNAIVIGTAKALGNAIKP